MAGPPIVCYHLQAVNLALMQLSPNSYKYIVSSLIIWARVHPDSSFTLEVLLHYYTFRKDPKDWFYMSPKSDKDLVTGIPNKVLD